MDVPTAGERLESVQPGSQCHCSHHRCALGASSLISSSLKCRTSVRIRNSVCDSWRGARLKASAISLCHSGGECWGQEHIEGLRAGAPRRRRGALEGPGRGEQMPNPQFAGPGFVPSSTGSEAPEKLQLDP